MSKKQVVFFLSIIMVIAAFLRLWQIWSVPPGLYPDEAMNGNNGLEALKTGDFKLFYPENNGREGLFINIQALSAAIFGNVPWALRLVSALFGIFTVLGLYLLTKELFQNKRTALLASFFLATSFWHLIFSRIGFRAIMAPAFLVWAFYLLFKIANQTKEKAPESETLNPEQYPNPNNQNSKQFRILISAILSGLLFGLGFHSYIAYRVAPILLISPFIILWKNQQKKLIAIFLFFVFLAALPLGIYFLKNPADFLGRTSQISVFSVASPLKTLAINTAKTAGMFFVAGDYNWRHNFAGSPELWWPVAILFALGILISIKKIKTLSSAEMFLFMWLIFMLLPVIISSEGLPHALRSIIVIPVAMIFAAIGMEKIIDKTKFGIGWLLKRYADYEQQILRIRKKTIILLFIFLLAVLAETSGKYFVSWALNHNTFDAFSGRYAEIGKYLNTLPRETQKYVIVNADGAMVKNIPMPTQTIMFVTDSYRKEEQKEKNITYLLTDDIYKIQCPSSCAIITMETDPFLREKIKHIIPGLTLNAQPDFQILFK